jgi:hypothetical protein
MPFRHWIDLRVIRLLVSHAITDACAILIVWGLIRFTATLLGPGPYVDVLDHVERSALILLVIIFAAHLVYNVFREMFLYVL